MSYTLVTPTRTIASPPVALDCSGRALAHPRRHSKGAKQTLSPVSPRGDNSASLACSECSRLEGQLCLRCWLSLGDCQGP